MENTNDLQHLVGEVLENHELVLDGLWLKDCVLTACTLTYRGGSYRLDNTKFTQCAIKLEGCADWTRILLSSFGLLSKGDKNVTLL